MQWAWGGGGREQAARWEEKPQKPWRGFEKPSDFICLAPCMKSRHSNRRLQHKHEAIGCSALPIPCSALLSVASVSCCCIIAAWKHQQATFSPDQAATSPLCPRTFAKRQQLKQQKSLPWVCLGCNDIIFLSALWRSFTPKQLKHTRLN